MSLAYHYAELKIAQDSTSPLRSLPPLLPHYKRLLDIGCGIGQTLIALRLPEEVEAFGLDTDSTAIAAGLEIVPKNIRLLVGSGEELPFAAQSFDLVFSRVSLPYMNLGRAISEVARVLRPGGDFWGVFHSFRMAGRNWRRALGKLDVKETVFNTYVLANGSLLHLTGQQFEFPFLGKQESFQTEKAIRRVLRANSLMPVSIQHHPLTVLARKVPPADD